MLRYILPALLLASTSLAAVANPRDRVPVFRICRDDPQTSLTLDPSQIQTAWEDDGSSTGDTPSLTSSNNFINWCMTAGLPLMNGSFRTEASCNPVPMGAIPSSSNMPSIKFVYPTNFVTVPANTTFTVQLAVRQLMTGYFTSGSINWYGAPQQLDESGFIKGHTHISIESLTSLNQTEPNDPSKYAFFAFVSARAVDGIISQNVTGGLPVGHYKIATMNAAANHQPVVVGIPNHAALDDAFTVV